MTCDLEQLVALAEAALAEREIDPAHREAILAHLAACDECRAAFADAVAFERGDAA